MNIRTKFRFSIVTYLRLLSVLHFLAGYGALECLHRFSDDNADLAISTKLEQKDGIAWFFIGTFALLIGLSLWAQFLAQNRPHVCILAIALLALAGIVTSEQTTQQHMFSLVVLVIVLSISMLLIVINFTALTIAITSSLVFAIVFCSIFLFIAGKPGIAERLLFAVFGISTVIAFSNCSIVNAE